MEKEIKYTYKCILESNSRGVVKKLTALNINPSHIVSINHTVTGVYCYYYE